MLPLTKQYALAQLEEDSSLTTELRKRWLNFINELLMSEPQKGANPYDHLEIEHQNISDAIAWCWENNHINDFLKFADRFTSYLWVRGYWAENRRLLSKARETAVGTKLMRAKAAVLTMNLAYVLALAGELDEAEKMAQEALAILQDYNDPDSTSGALSILGHVYIQKGELNRAEETLLRGTEVAKSAKDRALMARLLRNLGQVHSLKEDYEVAMDYFDQALRIFETQEPKTDQLSYTYRLAGITAMKQGNFDLARNLFFGSLKVAKELKVRLDIARTTGQLAVLEETVGNLQEAIPLAHQAKYEYLRLGDTKNAQEMDELIEKISPRLPIT